MSNFDIENDAWLQNIYVDEIKILCEQVEIAVRQLNETFKSHDTRRTFFYLRSIVSSCATISQFFWPIRKSDTADRRAIKLKQIFSLSEASILKDRSFRHHLIHVDERAVESPNRMMFRQNIGPRNMVSGKSVSAGDFLEHYVLDEHVFIFRGDEFHVQDIINEIQRIHAKANEITNRSLERRHTGHLSRSAT